MQLSVRLLTVLNFRNDVVAMHCLVVTYCSLPICVAGDGTIVLYHVSRHHRQGIDVAP